MSNNTLFIICIKLRNIADSSTWFNFLFRRNLADGAFAVLFLNAGGQVAIKFHNLRMLTGIFDNKIGSSEFHLWRRVSQ